MKYERLTEREDNAIGMSCEISDIIDRLCELEDKIEAGTLVEVGKPFIEYDEIGGGYLIMKYEKQSKGLAFTREEAEKRLEELRGEV